MYTTGPHGPHPHQIKTQSQFNIAKSAFQENKKAEINVTLYVDKETLETNSTVSSTGYYKLIKKLKYKLDFNFNRLAIVSKIWRFFIIS